MRGRGWTAVAAATAIVLGATGCTGAAARTGPRALRDALLTADRLPPGYALRTGAADLTTTRAPSGGGSPEPLAEVPCEELDTDSFLTRHAPPLEDVAVGVERPPADDLDRGWSGRESLERYPPGRAARILADLLAAALRCAAPGTALVDGTRSERTVAVEPLGGGLLLHVTWRAVDGGGPVWTDRTAVLRDGDVLLVVQENGGEREAADLRAVVDAAVAAYQDAYQTAYQDVGRG
ncbi:hypothetical protein HUT16_10995 [Kitasatospora sp. NA04385]|uniref:hypothetical protein n=1 Tax=Kitasatospora sp. NA04385 TaxID=2742135 RepID=UPI001590861F|nr:hypothetical protein [Kitasatospora sp. NA04385]QKW19523.1 hypothetical protein HUT16_10995 [Kitasatospora sp. NA04385]